MKRGKYCCSCLLSFFASRTRYHYFACSFWCTGAITSQSFINGLGILFTIPNPSLEVKRRYMSREHVVGPFCKKRTHQTQTQMPRGWVMRFQVTKQTMNMHALFEHIFVINPNIPETRKCFQVKRLLPVARSVGKSRRDPLWQEWLLELLLVGGCHPVN